MDIENVIKNRYSVRSYKSNPVEQDKLDKIIDAAILAPTAVNFQPFRILLIDTQKNKESLFKIYSREWFVQAPYVMGICALPKNAWTRHDGVNFSFVDAAIVMDYIILMASSLGLGTCRVGAFKAEMVHQLFNIPDEWEPVVFTPIGYANDQPLAKKRKTEEQLLIRYV